MRKGFLIILLLLPSTAFALEWSIGYMPVYYSFDVIDPDGPTDSVSDVTPWGAVATVQTSKNIRYFLDVSYYDFTLDASTTQIGQKAEILQFTGTRQHYVRLSRNFKFWGGYGLAYNYGNYESRHTIDSDGFLATLLPNREEHDFGLVVNIGNEWAISRKMDLGLMFSYIHALDNGPEGFRLALTTLF